jgi:hypothetical protein
MLELSMLTTTFKRPMINVDEALLFKEPQIVSFVKEVRVIAKLPR